MVIGVAGADAMTAATLTGVPGLEGLELVLAPTLAAVTPLPGRVPAPEDSTTGMATGTGEDDATEVATEGAATAPPAAEGPADLLVRRERGFCLGTTVGMLSRGPWFGCVAAMFGWILAVTVAREVEGRMVLPSVEPVGTNPSTETPVLAAQGFDDVIFQSGKVLVVSER